MINCYFLHILPHDQSKSVLSRLALASPNFKDDVLSSRINSSQLTSSLFINFIMDSSLSLCAIPAAISLLSYCLMFYFPWILIIEDSSLILCFLYFLVLDSSPSSLEEDEEIPDEISSSSYRPSTSIIHSFYSSLSSSLSDNFSSSAAWMTALFEDIPDLTLVDLPDWELKDEDLESSSLDASSKRNSFSSVLSEPGLMRSRAAEIWPCPDILLIGLTLGKSTRWERI